MKSYYSLQEKIFYFALLSRIVILGIQVVANWIIPDHEADAFVSPPDPDLSVGIVDQIVTGLIGGLVRWDAQYFIHIAEYGYTHENTLAFFPLYPLLVRLLANVAFIPLHFIINYHTTIILVAVILNFCLFIIASGIFYQLSGEVLGNEVLAYRASILFCINPASIFFSAPYSESLFALCTFCALLNYERGGGWAAPSLFGAAGCARSNGLVNIGFVLYHKLQHCSAYYYRLRSARSDSSNAVSMVLIVLLTFNYTLVPLFVASFCVVAPFLFFQLWCYKTYCGDEAALSLPPHLESFVRTNFLHSPDLGEAEWCYAALPLAYTHLQDKYWDVGLLRYYELRQAPNFLLAVPVALLVICHAALYFVDNPHILWSLGIPHPDDVIAPPKPRSKAKKNDANPDTRSVSSPNKANCSAPRGGGGGGRVVWCSSGVYSWRVFVYTVHSLAVCFFCLLFVNVQVTTRLVCSSCPVVFWFAAHLMTPDDVHPRSSRPSASRVRPEPLENMDKIFTVELVSKMPSNFWGQIVLSYFLLYYFLGTVIFSNFLPWT